MTPGIRSVDNSKIWLIVNADDYGYFGSVTRGILDGAREGLITAAGILANSPDLDAHLQQAAAVDSLDCGVHLNLSYGEPLSDPIRRELRPWGGRFPGKFRAAAAVLARRLTLAAVETEWRAQIQRCHDGGVRLWFLNSHEHVHMLPALFGVASRLAAEFAIPHIRLTRPEWDTTRGPPAAVRNLLLGALSLGTALRRQKRPDEPRFLGSGVSGRLTVGYLRVKLPRLETGRVYELMCHPGYFDPAEVRDPALVAYHGWEEELSALRSPTFHDLRRRYDVGLIGYRHLPDPRPSRS